jgi:hypothetical protein
MLYPHDDDKLHTARRVVQDESFMCYVIMRQWHWYLLAEDRGRVQQAACATAGKEVYAKRQIRTANAET